MCVRQERFEALARYVSKHYPVVPLDEQEPAWGNEQRTPRLAFTFDDGWTDNADIAAPIARKYGTPFCIFICPSKVGLQLPFWPERVATVLKIIRSSKEAIDKAEGLLAAWAGIGPACIPDLRKPDAVEPLVELLKSRPNSEREEIILQLLDSAGMRGGLSTNGTADSTMTWAEIRFLRAAGVIFGSHTKSHQMLTRIPLGEAQREVTEAKEEIEKTLECRCVLFSYPNGDWSWQVRNLVGQAGYRLAFTNQPGTWTSECDPLLIPRVNIWEGKLVGFSGSFSPIAFEYATFWKAYRAEKRQVVRQADRGIAE